MRQLIAFVGLVTVLTVGASAQGNEKSHPKTCMVKVSGMACSACAKTVEKTVSKIDGVRSVIADQPKGVAEVSYDPTKTTPEAIAKVINKETNFKADVIKQ